MSIVARAWSRVVSRSTTIVTKMNAHSAKVSGPATDPGKRMTVAASTCIGASTVRTVDMKTVILLQAIRNREVMGELTATFAALVFFPC